MNTILKTESTFKSDFLSSFLRPPSLSNGLKDNCLLGNTYEKSDDPICQLTCIESYCNLNVCSPFSYHINSFPYYMLLFTKSGQGYLRYGVNHMVLKENTLLFFDCRQSFSLSIDSASWNFDIYFLSGYTPDIFQKKFSQISEAFALESQDHILQCLAVLGKNQFHYKERSLLLDYKYLNDLFTFLAYTFVESEKEESKLPPYLAYMKKSFDSSYSKNFSLQNFEDTLQISRYRLCREFSKQFGDSPIQYLNKKRVEAAKNLLRSTDMPIHEIASSVGIDNANHFINIFKKYTGNTPYSFRQEFLNY